MIAKVKIKTSLDKVELPEIVKLRSGATIDPSDDHWHFIDGNREISINFELLPIQVRPLKSQLKLVLINVLENNASVYARNLFGLFKKLAEVIAVGHNSVTEIEKTHIVNFIAAYKETIGMESYLSALITRWTDLGLAGFSDEAVGLIRSRRKPGNVKGEAVRTMDPVSGPLAERTSVHGASRWVKHHRQTLEHCAQLLSILENPMVEQGALVKLTGIEPASRLAQAEEARNGPNSKAIPAKTNKLLERMQRGQT